MTNPSNQDLLDKLQRSDHDTLIRLETKVDSLTSEVKSANEGANMRIADHEVRLRKLEDIVITSEPARNIARIDDVEKRINSLENANFINKTYTGAIGGGIVFLLYQLPTLLKLLGVVK